MVVGFCLVVAFILLYYRLAGVFANLALLLNLVIISGALAAFQATLTLPGIAGIILTIGMAVDANVLIFERVREEHQDGQDAVRRRGGWLRQGYPDHFGRQYHHPDRGPGVVPVRNRAHTGVCGDPVHRYRLVACSRPLPSPGCCLTFTCMAVSGPGGF